VLCPRAIELGIGRIIELERASGGGNLRFSCIALAKKVKEWGKGDRGYVQANDA